jgi:acyl-CoA thioester hydrolase
MLTRGKLEKSIRSSGVTMKVLGAGRELAHYPFVLTMRTRFSDLDPQHHVNNVVVAEYYQESRITFHRSILGEQLERSHGERVLVAHHAMDYLAEIRYPGEVAIGVGVSRIGNSSYTLVSAMFQETLCVGVATTVLVHADAQGPAPLPEALRNLLALQLLPRASND